MKLTDADIARLKAATRWTDEDLQLLAEAGLLDLLQQRDPAAEIAEYDRSTTLLGRIFNDLARGGASALANLQGAMALGSGDPVAVQRALEAAARVAEMPQRPVIRQMIEEADAAGGFWEGIAAGLKAASRDPLGAVAGLALESLPAQLPAYLAAILSRRPMVGAGAMGATSFLQEFGSALAEEAAKRGIDPNSPEVRQAVIEALADPTFLANAREHGAIRGAIIGLLDAVAARLAGQMLVPESVAKSPLAREAANIAVAQPAAQMAAGAGGEALAQLATEGKVTSPGEVLAEALGELGGVPVDVAVFGRERIADTIRKAVAEREARQERERAERAAKAQAALGPSEEDDAEAQRRAAIETILPFVPEAQGDPNFFAGWDDATLFTAQERIIRRRLAEMQSPMEGMPVPPDPPPPDAPVEAQKLYAAQMRAYAREVRDFYRRAVAARENALEHQKTFGEPIASTQAAQLQTAQKQPAANVIYQHPALGNIQLPTASPDAEAAQRGLAAVLEHALERQRVEQERQAVMREVLRKFDIAVPEGAQPLDVEELFEREIGTRVRRLAPDIELPKIERNSSARVAQLRERNNAILRALPEVLTRQKAEARSAFKLADVYRRRIEDQANATIEIEGAPQPKKGVVRDPQAGGEPLGDVNVRFVPVIGNYPVRPLRTARRQTSKGVTYTEYVFEAIDPRTGEPMRDKDGTPIILRISDPNDVRLVAYKIGPKNKDFISRAKGPADEKLSIPRAQSRVARVEDMGDEAAARGELKGAYELGELIGEERDFGVFLARGAHTFEVRFGRRTTSGRWYAVGADQIPRTIRAQLENAARWYMAKQRWMPEPPPQGEDASPGPDQPSPSQPSDNREAAALPSSTATSQREDLDEPRTTEKEAEKEDEAAITAQPKQALPRPEPQPQQQPQTKPAETKKQADTPRAAQPKEVKPKTAQPKNEPAQKRRRTKRAKDEQTEPKPQRTGGLGPIAPGSIGPIPPFIGGGAGGLGGGLGGGGIEVGIDSGAGVPPMGADMPGIEIPPELMGATQQAPEKNAPEGTAGGISAGQFYEDKAKWLRERINQIVSSDKPASFKLEKLFQLNSDIHSLRRGALYAAALFNLDQEFIKSFDQLIDLWHDAARQVRETMDLPQQFEFVRLSVIKKPGRDPGVFNVYAHVDTVFKEDTTYSLDDVPLVTPVRDKSGIVIEKSLANEPNIVELVLEVVKAADIDPRHVTVYKQSKEDRSLAGAIVLVDKGEKPSFRYILSINQAEWKRAQMIDRAAILAHEIGHCILAREQILKPEAVAALAEHGKKEIEQIMKRHGVFGMSIYNLDGWMELSSKRIREMRTPPKDFNPAAIEPYVRSFAEYFANMTMRYMIERSDRVFAGLPELARNLIRRAALLLTRFWARFRRFLLGDKSGSATGEAFREFLDKVVARHVAGMAAMANMATGQTTGAVEEAASPEIKAEGYRATIERIIDAQILDDQRHNIDKQLRDTFNKVNKYVLVPLKGAVARRRRNSRFIEEAPSSGNIEKWRSRLDAASQEIKDIINEAKDQYKPFRIYGVNDPITPVIEFDITNDRLHKLGFTSRAMITWQRDEYGYDVPHGKLRIMLPPGTPPIKDDVYKGAMHGVSGEYTIDVPLELSEDWLDKFLDARAKFLIHMRNAGHILLAEPTDVGIKEQEKLKQQLKELIDEKFGGNASAAAVAVQANKIGRDYVVKRLGASLADLEKFYSKEDWDIIISGVPFADSPVPVVRRIVHEMARLLPPETLQGEMRSDAVTLARKLIELGREFGIHKSPDMQALAERVGAPEEGEPDKKNDEPADEVTEEEESAPQADLASDQAEKEKAKIAAIIDNQIASDEAGDIGAAKEVADKLDLAIQEVTKELEIIHATWAHATNKKKRAQAQEYQRKFRDRIEERKDAFKPVDVTIGGRVNEITFMLPIPTPSLEALNIQTEAIIKFEMSVLGDFKRTAKLIVSVPPGAAVVPEAGTYSLAKWSSHDYEINVDLHESQNIITKLLRERAALFRRIRNAGRLPLPEPTSTTVELEKHLNEQFKKALEPYGEKNISWVLKHDKASDVGHSFVMSKLGLSYNDLENLYGVDEARSAATGVRGTEDPLAAAREFLIRLAFKLRSILLSKQEKEAHRQLNRKLVALARELGIQYMMPFDELAALIVNAQDAHKFGQMSHTEREAFLAAQLDEIFELARDDLAGFGLIPKSNEIHPTFRELITLVKSSGFDSDAWRIFFRSLAKKFERASVPHISALERETNAKNDLVSDKTFAKEHIPVLEREIKIAESLAQRVNVYLEKLKDAAGKKELPGVDEAIEVAERVHKRLQDALPRARARLRELQDIRDRIDARQPATKVGEGAPKSEMVVTPDGSFRFETTFEVVPASTLKHASGELQPRDRTRAGSDMQIRAMAAQLDPDRLVSSRESDRGAPIVDENSVVLSGNGRVAAIKMAAAEFPEKYEEYLGVLKGYGFEVEGIDTPILIRRARGLTPEQKRTIAVKSLAAADLRLSAAERAMVDAEKVDHEMLRGLQGNPDGSSFTFALAVRPFFEAMPATERAEFMDHNGHLTPEGVERIQAAVFARAYGDRRLVELMIEEREEPTIRNALLAVAADWALMREQGDPQYDITKQLIEAISLIRRSRTVPGGIRALLRQVDAFERRDPITELLARLFYNSDMSRLADQRTMIVRLQSYAASVLRRSQAVGDLFKDAPTTPQQILEAILRATQQSRGVTLYSNPIGPLAQLMYNTARDAARFFAGIAAPWVGKALETPAGKWLRDAIKDTNAYLLSTGGPPFLDRAWRLLSTSTHEYARWIAEQYGSRIAIEKIVNVMGPRAGSVDIGDTYEEEVEREGTRYMRRWDQIVREARGAGVTDEEIVQALTRTGTVSDAAKRYAQRLRKLFDELHQHAVDAGIKMGYRADYFTRVLDPARVSEDYEGFVERAASLYRQNGLDAEAAKQAARELAHVIVTGGNYGVFDLHHAGAATPSIFRQREFGPDADRVLAPYYDRNLDAIGARYISALVKRAAFARRFGDDAQRLESIFEEIRQELEKRGKGAIAYTRLRNEMVGYLRSVLGIGLSQSAWRVSALVRMFGTLMMLEKAVLASLIEPMIVAGRSGSLREGLRALRDTVRALRKNKRPPEIMDLALEAGIIAGDIADAILAQRWFGSDPLTRVESEVLTAYFRRIGLEQWTNASRIAATGAAVRFLNRIFSQRTNENVLLARELGLDYDQAAEFWAQKGLGSDPLYASLIIARSKDPVAEALRRAVHRFVNDVVISARRGDRPRWANTALGAVIFQFSAYSWGYGRRVLMRPLRLSQSGMPHMAMARYLALAFVPMLVAMAVMAYGIEDIKDELYGLTDKYYYGNRLTPVAKWERAVSRSGLFAGYDPIYQLMGSTRFEQDAAKLVFGPVPGMAVRGLGALRDVFFANAPETRTAERNVIRWMYDFFFEPAVNFALTGVQSPIAKGLASFITVYGIPSLREPAVSAIAGPLHKPPRPIQGVLESVKLPHKERP